MFPEHLILAGGGHTHALLLLRWAMYPNRRPKGLVTLINRSSTSLYSGMVPGLIAGYYKENEALIDLRKLCNQAGVAFVIAEIVGLDLDEDCVLLKNRPPAYFDRLSIDVGSVTNGADEFLQVKSEDEMAIPIKPLEKVLDWVRQQDIYSSESNKEPINVIGAGLAGVEVAFALRKRWPKRLLKLQAHFDQPKLRLKKVLTEAKIDIVPTQDPLVGPALRCTGSHAPGWLEKSGLPVDCSGRVLTEATLQVVNFPHIFAAGDCGVISNNFRPASGVWAVRAAKPLARNLERFSLNLKTIPWYPQRRALQLLGGLVKPNDRAVAWALWGGIILGPFHWLWRCKEAIDRRFMARLNRTLKMNSLIHKNSNKTACRGCAAKVGAKPLFDALHQAKLSKLNKHPEDAAFVATSLNGECLLQSVDGFPALVSDPWLNARLTTLHACSDLWASGAFVRSAQCVITLPATSAALQKELLAQSLSGIQSALDLQGANLIGGHTVESRSEGSNPISLEVQISLTINGFLGAGIAPWTKGGFRPGDELLLSRALGSGVLFRAAMLGGLNPHDLDAAVQQMATSQHYLIENLQKMQGQISDLPVVHACTDVTGFGLLGHLGEMIHATNYIRSCKRLMPIRITLEAASIASFNGAMTLFDAGYASTLAPKNRSSLYLLEKTKEGRAPVELDIGDLPIGSMEYSSLLELIVDPQTCGPLMISVAPSVAQELVATSSWYKIGRVY